MNMHFIPPSLKSGFDTHSPAETLSAGLKRKPGG
jgi:hypothetical protein